MRILVADDERPARAELTYMLGQLEAAAQVDEARNGEEALDAIGRTRYDVVFLDINMPGASGLTVAAAVAELPDALRPLLVFATAYDAHAVRAFELAALDYIVKPFQERRLAQTMQRIRAALAQPDERDAHAASLQTYLSEKAPAPDRLWAERENKNAVLVRHSDIMWVEAGQKRVMIVTQDGESLAVRYTIKALETRLASAEFVRVHKAYLVNLDYVTEVVPWFSGTYQLRMADDAATEIPLSRQYGRALRARLE